MRDARAVLVQPRLSQLLPVGQRRVETARERVPMVLRRRSMSSDRAMPATLARYIIASASQSGT